MAHPAKTRDAAPEELEVRPPESQPPRPAVRARIVGLRAQARVAIAVVVVIGALKAAQGLLLPIAFGIVIALALAPVVRRLERLMPRWVASAVVVFALTGVLGF